MPGVLDPDITPLVGGWRLQSFRFIVSDTNEYVEPYGPNPNGRMVLTPAGRIMFLMMNSDRRPATNDAERAVLFNRMTAYTGMVRSDGPGRLITTIDVSADPTFSGEQLRLFKLEGDRLFVRSPERENRFAPGRMSAADIVFERERPAEAV
jgi:hypothetical protein